MDLHFSKQAQQALQIIEETHRNLFLTGKAGTGKSTLLEYFRENTSKKTAILAPTGVAAINVKGETIHSFFKLKPGFELDEAIHKSHKRDNKLYKNLQTIVIDEISMVRPDVLDAIDIFLRNVLSSNEPFAGIQMVFIGDLYQLPPVITRDERASFQAKYKSPFFFSAKLFENHFQMDFIELEKIYRQEDQGFINLLNAIRNKTITSEQIAKLNQRVKPDFEPEETIHSSHNHKQRRQSYQPQTPQRNLRRRNLLRCQKHWRTRKNPTTNRQRTNPQSRSSNHVCRKRHRPKMGQRHNWKNNRHRPNSRYSHNRNNRRSNSRSNPSHLGNIQIRPRRI